MKLIFGLGNPGKQYANTRHNVGFDVLDSYAIKQVSGFVVRDKFKVELAEVSMSGEKLLLARPLTFYNQVGESYRALLDFYKLSPEDTLVIHDELALPFGTVRVRQGGSDAGNNGIKSVNHYGGMTSWRLRVGVQNEARSHITDADFVLSRFTEEEAMQLNGSIVPTLHALIEDFASGSLTATSRRHD